MRAVPRGAPEHHSDTLWPPLLLELYTRMVCYKGMKSLAQWQDCRAECWEAWGPVLNPRQGRVGVRFLYKLGQLLKTFISYSLLSVARLQGEITLKSFTFISYHRSCYLCCLHIQNSSPSYISATPPLKGWRTHQKQKRYEMKNQSDAWLPSVSSQV